MADRGREGRSRRAVWIGGMALLLAGAVPVVLSAIGIARYLGRGYVEARDGGVYEHATWGLVVYGLWIVGGVALVAFAIRSMRRHLAGDDS